MKKVFCVLMALVMSFSMLACGRNAVEEVEAQIRALGTITEDSGDAIAAAEEALMGLKGKNRLAVSNASDLAVAKTEYEKLMKNTEARELEAVIHDLRPITRKSGPSLEAAEEMYNSADIETKMNIRNFDDLTSAFQIYLILQSDLIEMKINAIGEVTLESGPAIEEAKNLYESADGEVQALVYNISTLYEAQETLETLQEEAATEETE